MPYIIRPRRRHSAIAATCAALFALGAGSAQAAPPSKEAACKEPALSQPFLNEGDSRYYALAPGQTTESFGGSGWTLSGGATVKSTTLPNGQTGTVLDLPSGSKAVSPVFCVTSEYPTARARVRNVVGTKGVGFFVSYAETKTEIKPASGGQLVGSGTAWTLSNDMNMRPGALEGWQKVQIELVALADKSEYQIDNLYIDPYRR